MRSAGSERGRRFRVSVRAKLREADCDYFGRRYAMIMTIEMLLFYGMIAGAITGLVLSSHRLGCGILFIIPIAMIIYISRWQAAHPENIRSTSALDFMFGPLWPSLAAIAGFYCGRILRSFLAGK